jgi:hypothetical protein
MPWELRAGHTEGSRTHYLAGWGGHCGNRQKFWLVKNKAGPLRASISGIQRRIGGGGFPLLANC